MKNKFFKLVGATLALTLAVTCFAGCDKDELKVPSFSEETINIGTSGPLTGDYSKYGLGVYNAAKLAISEINANGGFDGIQFAFEMEDDKADPNEVNAKYYSLDEKGMQLSLGTVTTGACLAWKPLAKADSLFCLTPSATGDAVYADADNMYQMCFSDNNQGTAAAQYVKENKNPATTKIGIFYQSDDDYSKGIYDNFMAELGNESGFSVTTATFTKDSKNDFSSQANTLKDCEFVFLPIYYSDASTFMLNAKDVSNNKIETYYGCDGLDGIDSIEGFNISIIPQEVSFLSHFNSKATSGKAKEFIDKYTDTFGADTLNQFGASAYDCIYAFYNALVYAKENLSETATASYTAAQFNTLLQKVFQDAGFSMNGVTGNNIKWNANGTVSKSAGKYIVKNKD